MKRTIQIAVSLLAILMLAHPFDCFVNARTREAMDCCLKGQCAPTAKADDCCKNTVPGTNHFLGAKAPGHWTPTLAPGPPFVSMALPTSPVPGWVDLVRHPPPQLALTSVNLPLLI